jgi:hypothetical protein
VCRERGCELVRPRAIARRRSQRFGKHLADAALRRDRLGRADEWAAGERLAQREGER